MPRIMNTPQRYFGNIAAGRVLDVATGNGGFIGFLLESVKSHNEIIGIDTSDKNATAFAEYFKNTPDIHFMAMDAGSKDFPDDSFDTVCISNSLHHLPDLETVLAEMIRVLRPGGNFIVAEMYCDNQAETQMTHVLMHHWWAAVDAAKGIVHRETYTRQQILDILAKLDLQQMTVQDLIDLNDDPKDPETVKYLTSVVDQYLNRIEGLAEEVQLRSRGLELRQRVEEIGFHGATSLLFIAKKA
jgi:ubiquinone/menaquinone biosynthesis C-methylase UbiE